MSELIQQTFSAVLRSCLDGLKDEEFTALIEGRRFVRANLDAAPGGLTEAMEELDLGVDDPDEPQLFEVQHDGARIGWLALVGSHAFPEWGYVLATGAGEALPPEVISEPELQDVVDFMEAEDA